MTGHIRMRIILRIYAAMIGHEDAALKSWYRPWELKPTGFLEARFGFGSWCSHRQIHLRLVYLSSNKLPSMFSMSPPNR